MLLPLAVGRLCCYDWAFPESWVPAMDFIPDTPVLLAYVAGVIILTLTPGPDMTFFIGRAIAQNVKAGLAAFAGASAGLIVHSLFVAFGLSALIVASPALFTIIKVAGAAYLGWLAIDAIRNGSTFKVSEGTRGATKASRPARGIRSHTRPK